MDTGVRAATDAALRVYYARISKSRVWKQFRPSKWRKDLKTRWEALEKDECEWAHLVLTIWPNRVKKLCAPPPSPTS